MFTHLIPRIAVATCWACAAGLAQAAPAIELWSEPGALGNAYGTSSAVADLAGVGLRDRVATVVVREGRWQLCERPQFADPCLSVGPGRYGAESLPNRIASVRPMGEGAGVPGGLVPVADGPALTLFRDGGFSGRTLEVSDAVANLGDRDFNDAASSVEIRRGRWQLCTDADFRGACLVLGPGRHTLEGRYQDAVSSLRRVVGPRDEPLSRSQAILLYEDGNFDGRELLVVDEQRTLQDAGFNDRASSVEVIGGRWQLCTDSQYAGQCVTLVPGRYRLQAPFQDSISSLRPL